MDPKSSELEREIVDLKLQKARGKIAFTKTKNKLIQSIDLGDGFIDKQDIRSLQTRINEALDGIMVKLDKLCLAYKELNDTDSLKKMTTEIETINKEYSETHAVVRDALDSQKSQSSLQSECGSTNELNLGKDLWRQMKRVGIPIFNGDKGKNDSWYASLAECIDQAPATKEYKLPQLRQYLQGDALRAIDDLGYSAEAYDTAKNRLERKFGGERRKQLRFLDDIEKFGPMKTEDAKNIDMFADLLDSL